MYFHLNIDANYSIVYLIVVLSSCRIALDQGSRRGWFTYSDLAAMWEASDLQYSMMLVTKQTAKVPMLIYALTSYTVHTHWVN